MLFHGEKVDLNARLRSKTRSVRLAVGVNFNLNFLETSDEFMAKQRIKRLSFFFKNRMSMGEFLVLFHI